MKKNGRGVQVGGAFQVLPHELPQLQPLPQTTPAGGGSQAGGDGHHGWYDKLWDPHGLGNDETAAAGALRAFMLTVPGVAEDAALLCLARSGFRAELAAANLAPYTAEMDVVDTGSAREQAQQPRAGEQQGPGRGQRGGFEAEFLRIEEHVLDHGALAAAALRLLVARDDG